MMQNPTAEFMFTVTQSVWVFVFALVALLTSGGVAAFVALLRQHKRSLEMAYNALPLSWQDVIRMAVLDAKAVTDLADDATDKKIDEDTPSV